MKEFIKIIFIKTKRELKYLFYLLSHTFTRKNYEVPIIRYVKRGAIPPNYTNPCAFFCSYDSSNKIREYVYHYLKELYKSGFTIIFISSNDIIPLTDFRRLSKYCTRIINRENKGYDFYGWKIGLKIYSQHNKHTGILLVNDSVIGPLFDIKDIVEKLENNNADVIGMTNCFLLHPHLQSYFLYCKKSVTTSKEFSKFFNQVRAFNHKIVIIRKYEIGFSRLFRQRFKLEALYNLESIMEKIEYDERPKRMVDPTFHLWKPLINEFQFPFLKKNLARKRGVNIDEISAVLVKNGSVYEIDSLIDGLSD